MDVIRAGLSTSITLWLATAVLLLQGCTKQPGQATAAATQQGPRSRLTVLLQADTSGAWPAGLDPATNFNGGANLSLMNAIFGGLFQVTANADGTHPYVTGVLASGYEIAADGRTLRIRLRPGVRFSDGTAFDARAVRFNIERDLSSGCACAPTRWPWADTDKVSAPDEHTVELHFSSPYPAAINALPASDINWIGSPTALRAMGEQAFRIKPVGAGPFKVVSDELSSKLVLERNPLYWESDRPYLDTLVFQSIGSEQAAYLSLLAGDAQVAEALTAPDLISAALQQKMLTVTQQPATSPYVVQLNTAVAPLNDKRVREALYYATDVAEIRKGVFKDWYPASEMFTAPGGLFHHASVAGYREYDLEKARALVKEVGGIRLTLGTIKSAIAMQVMSALQTQWRKAGIDVEIQTYELATLVNQFKSGKWLAMLQTSGSYDPEAGSGASTRFRSTNVFSGVHDADLDRILSEAAGATDTAQRDALYMQAGKLISDDAYAPFILAFAPAQVSVRGVTGPGLSTKIPPVLLSTAILWQEVRRSDH